MTSEERALKFLTMTDSDERVIQLTRLLDQHAAEQREDCARIALDVAKVYPSRTGRIAPHIDTLAQLIVAACLSEEKEDE